ncbi:hypothetical protein H8E07_10140 [bacterium]|nr:hypothetical protein [bacterium]
MTDWILDARKKVSDGLVKMANDGSVPAANAVLRLLDEQEKAGAAERHTERMESLADSPAELCEYLGELGQPADALANILCRPASDDDRDAWKRGQLRRFIEVRAIEMARLRAGAGKVEAWMRVKP